MAMTRDDVIRLATEAGFFPDWALGNLVTNFERFAELVAAAEREACAKVCDEIETDRWNLYKGRKPYTGAEHGRASAHTQGESCGASACADAIRARGGE